MRSLSVKENASNLWMVISDDDKFICCLLMVGEGYLVGE